MRTKARERRSRAGKTARKQLGSLMHALSCIITSAGVSDDGMCKRQQQSTSPLLLYKMDLVRVTCPRQQKAALHSICCKKNDHLEAVNSSTFLLGLKSSLQVERALSPKFLLLRKGNRPYFSLTAVNFWVYSLQAWNPERWMILSVQAIKPTNPSEWD